MIVILKNIVSLLPCFAMKVIGVIEDLGEPVFLLVSGGLLEELLSLEFPWKSKRNKEDKENDVLHNQIDI